MTGQPSSGGRSAAEPGSTGWVVYGFWRPFLIFVPVLGVMVRPVFPGLPHQILLVPFEGGAEIQTAAGAAGRRVWSARRVHSARQGHRVGRCRVRGGGEGGVSARPLIQLGGRGGGGGAA